MKKNKIYNNVFYSLLIVVFCIMCYFMSQKEGYHEDEMFSYGSSNYKYDNVFQPYGYKDYINSTIDEVIFNNGNVINNIVYYLKNPNEFMKILDEKQSEEKPVWKTKQEAIEYVTIQQEDILSFFSIYYNQSRDAHPPLFYFMVHIVSIFFFGNFSKYIIFIINISLFVSCLIIIRKIFELLDKKNLTVPTVILYGLSIGAISTVIFQRMYMLLTFFIIYYTYINLSIVKNDFNINKNTGIKLIITIILGFLSQYYFCIYALFMFVIMQIIMLSKKKKSNCKTLLIYYLKSAIIGVLLFPASIYHIFFSYRGVSNISNQYGIWDFFKIMCESYSCNIILGIIILIIVAVVSIIILKKKKDYSLFILLFNTIGYLIIISKISPYLDLRYIMGILPIVAIIIALTVDYICKGKNKIIYIISVILLVFSIINLTNKSPEYLYKGYNENIKIAKENNTLKFIYIEDNGFNHIQSMPEFMIYDESMILNINKNELEYLENNKELKNEKEFIVSIKKYLNVEEILKQILETTKRNNCILLLDGNNDTGNVIYKISN